MLKKSQIAVIGAGNLGGALIGGLLEAGLPASRLRAADASAPRRRELKKTYGIDAAASNAEACQGADAIVLAVKPHIVAPAVQQIAAVITKKQLLISLAAAVPITAIEANLSGTQPVVRAMPNLAMTVGCSATALCANSVATKAHRDLALEIFQSVGLALFVNEAQMHAVTALSGSGPAYIALVAEALAAGGVKMGLPASIAAALVNQTILGAAQLLLETGAHPGVLRDQVSTPGGTTIYGLHELEQNGVRAGLISAVEAATERSIELSSILKGSS
jgi:pyrroline-5-carboxylate reductase